MSTNDAMNAAIRGAFGFRTGSATAGEEVNAAIRRVRSPEPPQAPESPLDAVQRELAAAHASRDPYEVARVEAKLDALVADARDGKLPPPPVQPEPDPRAVAKMPGNRPSVNDGIRAAYGRSRAAQAKRGTVDIASLRGAS